MFIERVTAEGQWLGTVKRLEIAAGELRKAKRLSYKVIDRLSTYSPQWHSVEGNFSKREYDLGQRDGHNLQKLKIESVTVQQSRKGVKATIGPVRVVVSLVKHPHFQFLNVDVDGLNELSAFYEIGGILGLDSHAEATHADVSQCKSKASLL